MAAYADWTFYEDVYMGNRIAQSDFDRLALRASEEVDYMTFQRAQQAFVMYGTEIQMAVCAAAEVIQKLDTSDPTLKGAESAVQSEKVGGYSVTYVTPFNTAQGWEMAYRRQLMTAVAKYLASTGLLYRGLD